MEVYWVVFKSAFPANMIKFCIADSPTGDRRSKIFVSFWKEQTVGAISSSGPVPTSSERNQGQLATPSSQTSESIFADLILLHQPSLYDFRERDDLFHTNLSTDAVGITPVYEMYPLGFKSIERFLANRGHSVRIINIASLMLRYRNLDVPAFLSRLSALAYGIDLHWMVHVQSGLALAEELKKLQPEKPITLAESSLPTMPMS
jgi:hypothetical protein